MSTNANPGALIDHIKTCVPVAWHASKKAWVTKGLNTYTYYLL
jgi:hypothetical protein